MLKKYFMLVCTAFVASLELRAASSYTPTHQANIFYRISKEGKTCGYILGSMHMGLPDEVIEKQKEFLPKWIKKCKTLYTEVTYDFLRPGMKQRIDGTLVPDPGTEAIAKEAIESEKIDIEKKHFEAVEFQYAMLTPSINLLHNYSFCKAYPSIAHGTKNLVTIPSLPFILPKIIRDAKKAESVIKKLREEYAQELVTEYTFDNNRPLFMRERNCDWIKQIKEQSLDSPTLYIVGTAHLPGPDGMIDLLEQSGYTCEALSLYSEPDKPEVIEYPVHKPIAPDQRAYYEAIKPRDLDGYAHARDMTSAGFIIAAFYNTYNKAKTLACKIKKQKQQKQLIQNFEEESKLATDTPTQTETNVPSIEGISQLSDESNPHDNTPENMQNKKVEEAMPLNLNKEQATISETLEALPQALKKIFTTKKSFKKYPKMSALGVISILSSLFSVKHYRSIPKNPYV